MKLEKNQMEQIQALNKESLKVVAEVFAKSGLVDKSMLGSFLAKVAYGITCEEKLLFSYKDFCKEFETDDNTKSIFSKVGQY